ncbi:lipoprotein [Paenibacillus sp. An7]|uniref:lipoprotein n=1 Tax=Paenibacillus sp. An7 TaxID=2689577 RepID=UPI001356A0DB|nr:lipoprotein [Paenibacillus sp. An7]
MRKVPLLFIFLLVLLTGCTNAQEDNKTVKVIGNPDANEVLSLDLDANIFMFGDLIYITGIDWVDELVLTPDEEIGEIKKQTSIAEDFFNGTSNVLSVGTKIYSSKERGDILLVKINGAVLKYYALVEG